MKLVKTSIFCVEIPNCIFRWFPDEKEAIKFAEMAYNCKIKEMDDSPIYEHPINETKESFCNFLNKREGGL